MKKRLTAVGICVLAAVLGFLIFIWADAFMSGKDFWRVAGAWVDLYRPKGFQLPFTVGPVSSGWESFGLFGLMAFGVFSFWCDEKREYHSVYVVAAAVIMLASCFGIYTEEMPGFFSLYLMFVVLAGVGLKPCICSDASPETLSGFDREAAGEPAPVGEGRLDAQVQQDEVLNVQMQQAEGNRLNVQIRQDEGNRPNVQIRQDEGNRLNVRMQQDEGNRLNAQIRQDEESRPDARMQQDEGNRLGAQVRQDEENRLNAQIWQDEERREREEPGEGRLAEGEKKVRYLDNPLPLPKKHVKRVLDYSIDVSNDDDFDFPVKENDDFDV